MRLFLYSLSEEAGSHEVDEMLTLDDKLEIASECWVEPVNGTVINCTSELGHFNDSVYSRIPDVVSFCQLFGAYYRLLSLFKARLVSCWRYVALMVVL